MGNGGTYIAATGVSIKPFIIKIFNAPQFLFFEMPYWTVGKILDWPLLRILVFSVAIAT